MFSYQNVYDDYWYLVGKKPGLQDIFQYTKKSSTTKNGLDFQISNNLEPKPILS